MPKLTVFHPCNVVFLKSEFGFQYEHLKNQMQLRTLTNAQAQNSNPITFVTLLCEFIAIALIFGLI